MYYIILGWPAYSLQSTVGCSFPPGLPTVCKFLDSLPKKLLIFFLPSVVCMHQYVRSAKKGPCCSGQGNARKREKAWLTKAPSRVLLIDRRHNQSGFLCIAIHLSQLKIRNNGVVFVSGHLAETASSIQGDEMRTAALS